MRKTFLLLLICMACFTGCRFTQEAIDPAKITSINIVDRNGLSETISSKNRLCEFDKTNFLAAQPYQKVMRVYGKEKNGDVRAQITSYHPNGQIKQYLESLNNRALGTYREWFANGQIKVETRVIGGVADLNTQAEESWLFDGVSKAWDEEGRLIAEISYAKGELEGEARYYHNNGSIWKSIPYSKNLVHGTQKVFLEEGSLFQTADYQRGQKCGDAFRYWAGGAIAYQERYKGGKLLDATYYDPQGEILSQIRGGNGERAIFGRAHLQELQEFKRGVQEGRVTFFDENKTVLRTYHIKHGEKQGEEIDYFPGGSQQKLLLTWHSGVLQGPVKTWYPEGGLESQREMCDNKKTGLLTAWFRSGALMLVEEYDNDKLLKGEYYRMGEKIPVSKIEKGKGVASLFNADGNFSKKIYYQDGKPLE